MGIWQSEFEDFCPVCDKQTQFSSWNDNDDDGTHTNCTECDTEFPIPKVEEGEPFFLGKTLYSYHIGNDDGISLERFNEK